MKWQKGQSGNPAGRRRNPEKIKQEEIIRKALLESTTPLEVLLEAMREAYEKDGGGAQAAAVYAEKAAPYIHPKLSNIAANVEGIIGQYTASPQPIPVEERDPISLKTNGSAAHSASKEVLGQS